MFNCELCLYSTDRSSNLKQHNESKKHIIRAFYESKKNVNIANEVADLNKDVKSKLYKTVKKQDSINQTCYIFDTDQKLIDNNETSLSKFSCKICGKSYNHRQNLWIHKQKHSDDQFEDSSQTAMLKQQIFQLQKKVAMMEAMQCENNGINNQLNNSHNMINSQNKVAKNMAENNIIENNNNQKIIVYQFVNQNYAETEPIKMLEPKDAKKLLTVKDDTQHTIADFIVFYYNKYNLDKFLGDIIIGAYKKEDPKEQQIWSSNVMKLTF